MTFYTLNAQSEKTMKDLLQPYHFKTKTVQLEDGELAYVKEGKGKKVLIFVHGLSSNADAWYRNIEQLREHFTCYAIDLPGYGRSYKKAENFTASYFAETINEFTKKLKIKEFTLVGHSMGGQASIKYAATFPEKLKGLILVAPAGIEEFTPMEGMMMNAVMTRDGVMKTSEEQIDKNYQMNFFKMPVEASRMVQDRKKIVEASDFADHADAIVKSVSGMLDDKVIDDFPKVKVPTLFIFGRNDLLIPNKYLHPQMTIEDVAKKGNDAVTGSKVWFVEEAGHFLNFEKPEEVNAAICSFMKDI